MANALEDRVRARLRQLRFERGLTLAELAARAGVATSTMSRLETGARGLSLTQVDQLARALEVTPEALLAGDTGPAHDGRTWVPIGTERTAGRRAYRVTVPPGDEPHLHSHEGHQWLYVLDGRLRLVVGETDAVHERGEAAAFSTWLPHWLGGPADLLVLFDPGGSPLSVLDHGSS